MLTPAGAEDPPLLTHGFEDGNVCGWLAVPLPLWYPDADHDGAGDAGGGATAACAAPVGTAAGGDCDDDAPFVRPGAVELCDGADSDCDGFGDPPGCSGSGFVRVVAAGDIACAPGRAVTATTCQHVATSDLAVALAPDAVLPLGDLQYDSGERANFDLFYGPSWGRLLRATYPVPGNHEYVTPGASGYFGYFGALAGDPDEGWQSFDLGAWHLVGLNSNCAQVGGCNAGSPQGQWLADDLAANGGACTLAYWHHARFSSASHGNTAAVAPFWEALHAGGADLVLAGHDHAYERFAPQDATGTVDPSGPRSFVVGTGGKSLYGVGSVKPQSEVRRHDTFGILELTLYANGYGWRFVPIAGSSFTDVGSALCHAASP